MSSDELHSHSKSAPCESNFNDGITQTARDHPLWGQPECAHDSLGAISFSWPIHGAPGPFEETARPRCTQLPAPLATPACLV
jgi:hypothetical protein